jgi:tRNA1(Val) A37 N6-methylase TrmN6
LSEISDITEDALLGGRITVRQPKRGYRVNVDTLLLAAAVEANEGARLMEAGCGVGAASLAVAARATRTFVLGVERDANMAAIARENVAANAMGARVEIVTGDALDKSANWGVFDGVFFNPPFDAEGDGRAPAESRRDAYITDVPVGRWVAALADRLKGGAALTLIHRAHKLHEILAAIDGRLGGAEVAPVHARAHDAAHRVLVRARKGSRAHLRILPGLVLNPQNGAGHTPEVEALVREGQPFAWG